MKEGKEEYVGVIFSFPLGLSSSTPALLSGVLGFGSTPALVASILGRQEEPEDRIGIILLRRG